MRDKEYLEWKRTEVLEEIKPICDAFGINDYDYEPEKPGEKEGSPVTHKNRAG